jgi:hypothetical protein
VSTLCPAGAIAKLGDFGISRVLSNETELVKTAVSVLCRNMTATLYAVKNACATSQEASSTNSDKRKYTFSSVKLYGREICLLTILLHTIWCICRLARRITCHQRFARTSHTTGKATAGP